MKGLGLYVGLVLVAALPLRAEQAAAPAPGPTPGPVQDSAHYSIAALPATIAACLNLGPLGAEARATTVRIGVSFNPDATPRPGSIRLLEYSGGSAETAQELFDIVRRAILRCGRTGYDLPIAEFALWQDVEIMFTPERMRIE